jgi:hypothetical protein
MPPSPTLAACEGASRGWRGRPPSSQDSIRESVRGAAARHRAGPVAFAQAHRDEHSRVQPQEQVTSQSFAGASGSVMAAE